jgi:hypothetical protein
MKRLIPFLALSILVSQMAFAQAASTVSAGLNCAKLGTTSISSGKKFTCTKNGKKLVWDQGLKIQLNAGASTPSAAPMPSSIPVSDIDPIRTAAFNQVHALTCTSGHPNILVTKSIGSTINAVTSATLDKLSSDVFNCFNNYFEQKINLKLFYITEKDLDLVNSEIAPLLTSQDLDHLKSTLNDSTNHVWGSIGSAGGIAKFNPATNTAYLIVHLSSYHTLIPTEYKAVMHEFTHVLQGYGRKDAKTNSEQSYYDNLPGYFMEGGAETLGYAFTASSPKEFDAFVKNGEKHSDHSLAAAFSLSSPAEVVTQLKTISFPKSRFEKDFQYNFGELFSEYILGKYGLDKFLALMKGASRYSLWTDNVQATLGVSLEQLYSDAAPWMLPLWKAGAW